VALAGSSNRYTKATLLAGGFTATILAELVEAGLASAIAECLPVWRGTPREVTRMRITDAGRRLILGHG
jgi:hypothetical protein